jgi:hypothetical protein
MSKPKTGKEIIERLKTDLESVYGVRFNEQGRVDPELSKDCSNWIVCERVLHFTEGQLARVPDPIRPQNRQRVRQHRTSLKS